MINKLRNKLRRNRPASKSKAAIDSADHPVIARNVPFESTRDSSSVSAPKQIFASTFQGAHDFNIGGSQFFNIGKIKSVSHYGGTSGMDILEKFASFNALHDSSAQDPSRQCHPGTRENILSKIHHWVDNLDVPERIFWLHGPAGVGKSAIAQTIANSCSSDKLAASFFFLRSDSDRNDGNRLFPTLAWQLAFSVLVLKHRISRSLEEHPDLPRKAVEVQFKHLIAQPFWEAAAGNVPHLQTAALLVIVDGVDECKDVSLQRRILKVLGKASADSRIPLRFLICSRPEAQIRDVLDQFRQGILEVDLTDSDIDDVYRDIEKYLKDHFFLVASNQYIDSKAWPGKDVIDNFVTKSSGQFVYASTIIKFVNDEYSSAISQLDIILGLRPSEGESPFAELDALYMEILQRQPHQAFLKKFLSVLIARTALGFDGLANDDSLLLDISKVELHRKLRGMHSLLKFEPHVDVHHKSFLEFLQDSFRSGQSHVTPQAAVRRYLELIVEALVGYASRALKEPDLSHGTPGAEHFDPMFGNLIRKQPMAIDIPFEDLEHILQPLCIIRNEFLRMPKLSRPWKHGNCEKCSIFFVIEDLFLYLAFRRGTTHPITPPPSILGECEGVLPYIEEHREGRHNIHVSDAGDSLSSLLADLHKKTLKVSASCANTVNLFRSLLRFNSEDIALHITSFSDAQKLVDFIFYMVNRDRTRSPATLDAARVAFALYARVPVVPQYLFLNRADLRHDGIISRYQGKSVQVIDWGVGNLKLIFQSTLIPSILLDDAFVPFIGICNGSGGTEFNVVWEDLDNGTLRDWRNEQNPTTRDIEKRILEVAKAFRLIHSLGIVLDYRLRSDLVFMDAQFHCKLRVDGVFSRYIRETPVPRRDPYVHIWTSERNVKYFALLFYEIHFNIRVHLADLPTDPPSKPEIRDDAWHLIQRCYAEDPEMRPTMSEIVEEMESWK